MTLLQQVRKSSDLTKVIQHSTGTCRLILKSSTGSQLFYGGVFDPEMHFSNNALVANNAV